MVFGFLFVLLFLGGFLVAAILFLLTLSKTLKAVSYSNRTIQPDQVWLLLIPVFNIYWIFIVVKKLSESIRNEFVHRGLEVEDKPTYNPGMATAIISALSTVTSLFFSIGNTYAHAPNSLQNLISLAGLIAWIAYWVTVNNYKKRLESLPPADFADSIIFGNKF